MKYIILMMVAVTAYGQQDFQKSYEAGSIEHVVIDNFKGNIQVLSSKGSQVRITATHQDKKASKTLKLVEHLENGLVYMHIDNPCIQKIGPFSPEEPFRYTRSTGDCTWDMEERSFPDLDYKVEVPDGVNVYLSTVMDGHIKVEGVKGTVYASNVNGSVELLGVANVTNGTTVNGDIDVYYASNPAVDGFFTTINGEINLHVPANASITTKFKSFAGELYTDLDAVTLQPEKMESRSIVAGNVMKIDEYSRAQIGSGEVNMIMETFNGNAYLIKNK